MSWIVVFIIRDARILHERSRVFARVLRELVRPFACAVNMMCVLNLSLFAAEHMCCVQVVVCQNDHQFLQRTSNRESE